MMATPLLLAARATGTVCTLFALSSLVFYLSWYQSLSMLRVEAFNLSSFMLAASCNIRHQAGNALPLHRMCKHGRTAKTLIEFLFEAVSPRDLVKSSSSMFPDCSNLPILVATLLSTVLPSEPLRGWFGLRARGHFELLQFCCVSGDGPRSNNQARDVVVFLEDAKVLSHLRRLGLKGARSKPGPKPKARNPILLRLLDLKDASMTGPDGVHAFPDYLQVSSFLFVFLAT